MKNSEQIEGGSKFSADFFRHDQPNYEAMRENIKKNPESPINYKDQAETDLKEAGVEHARSEAEKFFFGLNSEQDQLFFVSSNEVRALETANVFRKIAEEKGFEILKPEHSRSDWSEENAEGEIRVLRDLSLNVQNTLLHLIYNPDPSKFETIDWEKIRPETKAAWDEAREIIESDNKGSWGDNFFAHSKEVKKIIKEVNPEEKSAEDMFETNFKHLIRLTNWGAKKAQESGSNKNIKVLGFGHENYLGKVLNEYFGTNGIGYCETINFNITDEGVEGTFRDKKAKFDFDNNKK